MPQRYMQASAGPGLCQAYAGRPRFMQAGLAYASGGWQNTGRTWLAYRYLKSLAAVRVDLEHWPAPRGPPN